MLRSLLRTAFRILTALLRYFRPLLNGAGILLLLSLLVHRVVVPFLPSHAASMGQDESELRRPVPELECKVIRETRVRPERVQVEFPNGFEAPEGNAVQQVYGVDSAGRVVDSFRLKERQPEAIGGICGNSTSKELKMLRRQETSRRRLLGEAWFSRPVFEGRADGLLTGRICGYRFRDGKGEWSRLFRIGGDERNVTVRFLEGNRICGDLRIVNLSGKEFRSVQFRNELRDSVGNLLRTEGGGHRVEYVGPHDTLVISHFCISLELQDMGAIRHLKVKMMDAAQRPGWKLPGF